MRTRKRAKTCKFTEREYNSNNGFNSQLYSAIWFNLHLISFNFPVCPTETQKKIYRRHVLSYQHVLPCGICRENLKKNFEKLPLTMADMESRETFSRYLYKLHNLVNDMLGKPKGPTYEEVREQYEHLRARCGASKKKENGCLEPAYYGPKTRCIIKILPKSADRGPSLRVDKRCLKTQISR